MHACEAALWAYQATGNQNPYLDRATVLARSVTRKLASLTVPETEGGCQGAPFSPKVAGFIWEHYDTEWKIDYHYNKVSRAWYIDPFNLYYRILFFLLTNLIIKNI